MATDTAARTPPAPARPGPAPETARQLWQVPAFLIGVAAFVAAWQGWLPVGSRDPVGAFRRDLDALAAATAKLSPDRAELKSHLGRVAAAVDAFPELAPAGHYALGSGYVRLAELTADPAEAAGYWALARGHFEAFRPEQVPEADPVRLAFRRNKALAADLPPNTPQGDIELIRGILSRTPTGEDPGEAQRLVAELSLRLNPPDLRRAKEALAGYVVDTGLATPPASIARAKLRLSEVQLALGEADAARKWLEKIGPDAPPDVLAPAKAQLARIRMAEGDHAGAARDWEQVRAAAGIPAPLKAMAAYHLGVCRLLVKPPDPAAAAALFEEAAKSDGPEGPAAAVRLADLHLRSADAAKHKEAVGLLAAAVKGLNGPGEYANPLVPVTEAQAAFEFAVQVLVGDGAFDAAVAAADAYKGVAAGGRDREKRAEALAAWAAVLQKTDAAGGKAKYAAAADEYAALADARPADTDKAEMHRRAAGLYRQAGDPAATLTHLDRLVKLPGLPDEVSGPAWVEYAEALLAADRPADALKAFQRAIATNGPASTAARYRLARLLVDTRHPQKVEFGMALLQQIAEAERVGPAEQEQHERALVELAHEHIRSGRFAEAETWLEKQLNAYPNGPEAGLARLLLGVCLLQRANPAPPAAPDPATAARRRERALGLFKQVVADTEARKKSGKLGERDEWLRAQAGLRVLQVYQHMGKPYDVLTAAAPLLTEYRGTVEELIVLSLIYHAHKQLDKPELALRTRDQMREVFDQLKAKPGAFRAAGGEYSREYWEKVWFAPDPPPMRRTA